MTLGSWLWCVSAQAGYDPQWTGWPFGQGGFWPSVARLAFMAVILGVIALILRLLFGPRGPLRPKGLETKQEAEARRRDEAAAREAGTQEPGARQEAAENVERGPGDE